MGKIWEPNAKRILVDCDGCLCNWEYAFHVWLDHHGHDPVVLDPGLFYKLADQYGLQDEKIIKLIKNFNESAGIGFLPPLRDAIQYVKMLHEIHGYIFHVITSVGDDENVARLRRLNLIKLFGESTFEHVECLTMGSNKEDYLKQFKNTGLHWIEDNIQNAEDGLVLGLQPILVEHGFNLDYNNSLIPRVRSWKEIYELITIGSIQDPDLAYIYRHASEKDG